MLHFRSQTLDGVLVVEFVTPGIHDGPEIDDMSEELHELIGRSVSKKLILDLSRVRFVASRALSLLISLKQLIDFHHGQLYICGLRDQVQRVFRITRQDRFLSFQPTREEALAAINVTSPA